MISVCEPPFITSNHVHRAIAGSYTALLPYAQERYLANHVLMSAIDKLHKVYTTELEPIVWARSVGVEVLNELDSVKAAIMMSAGANPQPNGHGLGFLNSAMSFAAYGSALASNVTGFVQSLGKDAGQAATSSLSKAASSVRNLGK